MPSKHLPRVDAALDWVDATRQSVAAALDSADGTLKAVETSLQSLHRTVDRARVRAHLARAEARLRLTVPADVPAGAARTQLVDALARYRCEGEFPRNRVRDERTPVFRDDAGTRCAVAELAVADGTPDSVDAVAGGHNTVDLERDDVPEALADWLADAPLSLDEAALIQPTYGPHCPPILSCSQWGLVFWSVGLVAFLTLEALLYRGLDRLFPDRRKLRIGTAIAGSVALSAIVAAAGLLVWFTVMY